MHCVRIKRTIRKESNDDVPFIGFVVFFCVKGEWSMAIELRRLVEKVAHMDITLLAGEGGMHRLVTWVHMVETTEASSFLEGGEVAFSTGLGLNGSDSLLELVSLMYEKQVAGVVINIGPFIETIPQPVLDFCDTHDFPLFVIPWKIHLAEVMRIFCFAITKDEQRTLETAAGFKNAIFFPKQEELYVVPLSQQGFRVTWTYAVCVIKLDGASELPVRLSQLVSSIDSYARHNYERFAVFSYDAQLLIVAANYTEEELRAFLHDIHNRALQMLASGETLTLGCGKITKSVRCLYKSYRQAKSIQALQEKGKLDPSLIFYSDLGIYKLLMGIEDREIIEEYYSRSVQPLLIYDRKNNSDLAVVLRTYLEHNGSVKETADELFVHRNTVNYKLTRIAEILDADLSQLNVRLQLLVGFLLEDML